MLNVDLGQKGVSTIGFMLKKKGLCVKSFFEHSGLNKSKETQVASGLPNSPKATVFTLGRGTDHDISRQNFRHETKFGFLSYHHGHFVLPR